MLVGDGIWMLGAIYMALILYGGFRSRVSVECAKGSLYDSQGDSMKKLRKPIGRKEKKTEYEERHGI